jgi:hypothetical protein
MSIRSLSDMITTGFLSIKYRSFYLVKFVSKIAVWILLHKLYLVLLLVKQP